MEEVIWTAEPAGPQSSARGRDDEAGKPQPEGAVEEQDQDLEGRHEQGHGLLRHEVAGNLAAKPLNRQFTPCKTLRSR